MPVMVKSDVEIKSDVLNELKWDSRVSETEIGLEVSRGVVTLTGTVSSYAKKIAAQEAAHRVAGVHDVANDIHVTVPGGLARTDTEIAQAVRRSLEWDSLVPDEKIHSTVTGGWVTLAGEVDLLADREDAERVVRRLTGVKGVVNTIKVRTQGVDAHKIRKAIEEALERRADREARRIEVAVRDGKVSLAGEVRSWFERRAILGAVSHAPGVREVEDHLHVEAPV